MFERPHHLHVAAALQALDAELLTARGCLFGGGTAIVLSHGEYRESVDLDFLISDLGGYRELRQRVTLEGVQALARKGQKLKQARDVRADQYGVRTMLLVGGTEIKLEIVFEARIPLEPPGPGDRICGVATLTTLDMAATKLLANSDRWADDSVFSRDLIDLAMLDLPARLRQQALAKASLAYGEAVGRDLKRAIVRLKERRGRLEACMLALQMTTVPRAVLWSRIRRLLPRS